ncbi:phosphatidylinositol glycan anchor biosynthesis class L [Dermatophagoides pteronyssinus]|uniref:Uncharacterized protein n=2 Tax=Dermatophagoides pteronyssinus TaxID=6956 RepID=A0ABQ8JMQ1_DERPT|nr:probable N-acetylglucosaminyl-phosphatidylinositol de-N-acetylase [Dermatophagoides pteronyssinus]KAH9423702.1 hypothetical protein DERP_005283 [Dermatophagoides pteronyssinus]
MLSFLLFSTILFISWFILKHRIKRIDIDHNVLLITAHPDDELMFFGPTLLNELRSRIENYYSLNNIDDKKHSKIHLLCLCTGNYYGDGEKRKQELDDAMNELFRSTFDNSVVKNSQEKCSKDLLNELFTWEIRDDPELIDSPVAEWQPYYIMKIIQKYCQQNSITKIITFDQYGISGHSNHIAIYEAVIKLFNCNNDLNLEIYFLKSISIIRKYLALFDIICTLISSLINNNWNVYLISSLKDYLIIVYSLRKHYSQMVWFRRLFYSSTSRFLFINSYRSYRIKSK